MEGRTKITLGGVDYPLMFGYLSLKLLMGDKNRAMIFNDDGSPTELGVTKIVYSGHQDYCMTRNVEVLPFDQFAREFDKVLTAEDGVQVMTDILKVWSDSRDVQDLVKQNEEKKSQPETMTEESTLPPLSESLTES